MLQLMIKASSIREASEFAEKYGVFLKAARLSDTPSTIIGECENSYDYEVISWFCDTNIPLESGGFPMGSLLFYFNKLKLSEAA